VTLSGYAPILNKANRAVAIVGVDIIANDIYMLQKAVHIRALLVLLLGILLSLVLGMATSKRIVAPIKELVEGTRHIAKGELSYNVQVRGDDEIALLAASFNRMARALSDSQKKLTNYFYNVVQSLVRIMEARDPYIKGHSESVARYAEMIAVRMGFPHEKVELLKEIALLHDIGKLGIEERILNKKEALTDEEWAIIRRHPLIGEEMLKPILITEEMLAIVRGHHERYDGKGYPDRIGGDSVNIFAAILSVADAYDAMLSDRAYRSAMSKDEAIKQLQDNKNSQFNPVVVDTFVKLIKDGPV
jgi:putative nucleotidyltransferase with HDIG domain